MWCNMVTLQCYSQMSPTLSRRSLRGEDWPARPPDLNPLDFFLSGYLKDRVYTPKPSNLDELEANIRREIGNLDQNMIIRSIEDVRARARKCLDKNGGHFK